MASNAVPASVLVQEAGGQAESASGDDIGAIEEEMETEPAEEHKHGKD